MMNATSQTEAQGVKPLLAIGEHILTLDVTDGESTSSDSMTLTIENTPPTAKAATVPDTVIAGMDPIVLQGEVSDFDGDMLDYEWLKDGEVLGDGAVEPVGGGAALPLPEVIIPAGDRRFPADRHEVELRVYDGTNDPVSASVTLEVVDIR